MNKNCAEEQIFWETLFKLKLKPKKRESTKMPQKRGINSRHKNRQRTRNYTHIKREKPGSVNTASTLFA